MTNTVTIPFNEPDRLIAVNEIKLNYQEHKKKYDQIVSHAAKSINCEHAAITLVDKDQVRFISTYGMELISAPREYAFCSHAISVITSSDPNERLLEISDASAHAHFCDTPYVKGYPYLKSYLSYTLQVQIRSIVVNIGTLCVCSSKNKIFSDVERFDLKTLGMVTNNIVEGMTHI